MKVNKKDHLYKYFLLFLKKLDSGHNLKVDITFDLFLLLTQLVLIETKNSLAYFVFNPLRPV